MAPEVLEEKDYGMEADIYSLGVIFYQLVFGPPFAHVAQDILRELEGTVFVAHNAAFDYGFLREAFLDLGIDWHMERMCTVTLSRRLNRHLLRHNLDVLMREFSLGVEHRHRALDDARVTAEMFLACVEKYGEDRVAREVAQIKKRTQTMLFEDAYNEAQEQPLY